MDGDMVVRIVVPLSGDDAVRALKPQPVAGVAGTVWVGRGATIIPADLYAALAPRGGLLTRRYDNVLEITPSRAAPHAVPLPSGRMGILADVPPEISGDYEAAVIRGRKHATPRLVVWLRGATGGRPFDPAFTTLVRDALSGDEAARRAVGDALLAVARRVAGRYQLSDDDRAELVADLVARAWEMLPRCVDKPRVYWTVVMRSWASNAVSGARSNTAVLTSRANRTVSLEDWCPATSGGESASACDDAFDCEMLPIEKYSWYLRELLPLERWLVSLLANDWTLNDLGSLATLLGRVRAVVARALDEAGAPPFRPSRRQAFRKVRVPVQ
jgi:DNA-directed RNA polymerase specialized sigma24 family protein